MSKIYSINHWKTQDHYYFSEEFDDDRYELDALCDLSDSQIHEVSHCNKKAFAKCLFENIYDATLTEAEIQEITEAFKGRDFEEPPDYILELFDEMKERKR